jgi:dipeptidyl aminopeptidase/acylaminoacyl peptidase
MPLWEQRFRAPVTLFPEWSRLAPDRVVYASTESGIWQLHALDLATGRRRQVTDHPVGLVDGVPSLDGEWVLWFEDETGAEAGRWRRQPFAGGPTEPFLPDTPFGWSLGLAQAPGAVAAALSTDEGYSVHVALDGGPAREVYRSPEPVGIGGVDLGGVLLGGLSADGSLLCLEHAEHGDLIHPALRVLDPRTGATVADLRDAGLALRASAWSPVAGDQRLAFVHEREGEERPGLWNLATGERDDLRLAVEGEVRVEDWWPDGSALLLANRESSRDRLLRYDLGSGEVGPIPTEPGMTYRARVRPDGRVWLLLEQGHRLRRALDDTGAEVLAPEGACSPPARPYQDWCFPNAHGQQVHGFLVLPEGGSPPLPVMMFVHGGPTAQDLDRWQPEVQAYVDAGFAVGLVNYRGSTGYGHEWRDAIIGDIGGPELEDVNAGLQDLVAQGIADPTRAVVAGRSWGGYVTLLELGKHPELWRCGVAGVPVADYVASYDESSPLLQAYDRALLGGEPKDVPELMRDRSPISFVDRVRAPVLVLVGRNDSRCPFGQAMRYVERLQERGHPHEVYVYETGHSAFDVDERVRQAALVLDFLARHVPGVSVPG